MDKPKYPALDALAYRVASQAVEHINREIRTLKTDMPYKAQYVLEETIRLLQEKV